MFIGFSYNFMYYYCITISYTNSYYAMHHCQTRTPVMGVAGGGGSVGAAPFLAKFKTFFHYMVGLFAALFSGWGRGVSLYGDLFASFLLMGNFLYEVGGGAFFVLMGSPVIISICWGRVRLHCN